MSSILLFLHLKNIQNMKKFLLLITILVISVVTFAERISPKQAFQVAQNFIIEKNNDYSIKSESLTLNHIEMEEGDALYYIFNLEEMGFVIISGSNLTYPILAYSFDHNFKEFPGTNGILNFYKEQIRYAESSKATPWQKAKDQWKHYLADNFTKDNSKSVIVKPLLTTNWNQNIYYNTYCPWDEDAGAYYDYRVPNGCVALAVAQLMNYYRHPDRGVGGVSYIPSPYPRQTVIFSNHTYNWDAMCNEPTDYDGELAKIIYHVGVASQMGYSPDGSGAYTEVAAEKLVDNFKYSEDYRVSYQSEYLDTFAIYYVKLLERELDSLRPILYSGYNSEMGGGHAFILDGYDSDDMFHLNWGWGGSSNGYFQINHLSPGGSDFSYGARAITKLRPASNYPANCSGHHRNTASFGYITNGSTNKPYAPNPDCSWMVATPYAQSYTFTFDRLSLNPTVDYVTIYNGPSESDGIKAQYTGTTLPTSPVTVTADSVLITFTTVGQSTENNQYYGFLLSYTTTLPARTCNGTTNFNTEVHASISDGSESENNYLPQTNCSWLVRPTFVSGYAVSFRSFNLKKGDFVDIYDATTSPATLWNRFDIYNMPTYNVYNINFSKMKVNFVADNWEEGTGFELEYYAILNLANNSGIEELTLYPNPANDFITVKFSDSESDIISCKIFDITGKLLQEESIDHNGGESVKNFDVSNLASGLYLFQLETKKGKDIRKFAIQ